MRKILAAVLIGGSLAAGVTTAFAREGTNIDLTQRITNAIVPVTTGGVASMETVTSRSWAQMPEHDRR